MPPRFRTLWLDTPAPVAAHLARVPAVGIRAALDPRVARDWAARVLARPDDLVRDFGGEQLSLGRAFYTHLETGAGGAYFRAAPESDRLVERVLPGMQRFALDLLGTLVGARVRRRAGFAGPGVHVFPPGERVARIGGSVHHDVEGLAPEHVERRAPAYSLVVMLQPPPSGGGITLWSALHPSARRARSTTTTYRAGDALLFSSYRLHQIRGFAGDVARLSITVMGVEVDDGVVDAWF